MPTPVRERRTRPGAIGLVALLAVLTVAVMIVGNRVFIVKRITVQGNRYCTVEEVIAASGIAYGDGMFSIDSDRIRDGINANRYLSFVGIWRDLPSHIVLTVTERAPCATLMWMGSLVMLGDNGVALDITSQIDIELRVPMITGFGDISSPTVGRPMVFSRTGTGEAIFGVLAALELNMFTGEISELNVSVLDNLYLVTEDGLQITLGNADQLDEKIASARAVLPRLRATREVRGGVLDVSAVLQSADFRPPQ